MGPTHRGTKSGCKLPTFFDSGSDDGVSVAIDRGPTHRGAKSGCKLPTLFDSDSDRVGESVESALSAPAAIVFGS